MVRILQILGSINNCPKEKRTKTDVFIDQIIDSAIVAGITFFSSLTVTTPDMGWKPALVAGALTFLIKLKEYRNIK